MGSDYDDSKRSFAKRVIGPGYRPSTALPETDGHGYFLPSDQPYNPVTALLDGVYAVLTACKAISGGANDHGKGHLGTQTLRRFDLLAKQAEACLPILIELEATEDDRPALTLVGKEGQ